MGEAAIHQFGNILLGGRGGTNPGQLKIHSGGFLWKKTGGGKVVEVAKADIQSITWTRVPNAYQLGVRLKAGSNVKFNGFREQDVSTISSFVSLNMGVSPEDLPLALSGRNWGEIELKGNTLAFMVGGKQGFEISVADVSQTQVQGKNDVLMEFHVDDTASVNEKDTLMELSFHIPNNNTTFIGDEERPSAQVFCDRILSMADVGPSGADAIALFEEVGILTPRGRYNVELHLSFLRLQGQANDFKIQYASVVRLFILPKANQSYTYDVITLDPPIRKGQTFYPHIVLQFPTEEIAECTLSMSPELLESKYKDRLQPAYKGLSHEVFGQILRGLSGAKVTRPGKFRSSQDSYAVRASLKAEEGTLYPLEKSFFFLPKPPTLILHDEIEYVEFERHGAGNSISSKNFDLIIRLKSDQEHQFRNIMRNEYHNLFRFVSSKELKILNVDPQGTSAVVEALQGSDDEGVDPHLNRIKSARESGAAGDGGDSDEEDEDFVADRDDAGSPTDESDEEGGGNASNSSGGEEEEEEEEEDKPVKKKEKKSEVAPKASTQKRKSRKDDDEDGGKKKKRKKKDPNAPKRALSGFFYFSMAEREIMKKTNPNVGFKDMGRVLGEKWRNMSAEEKEPYEVKARLDKERYKEEMAGYSKAGGVVANDSAGSEEEE